MYALKQNNLTINEFAKYCAIIMSVTNQNFERILKTSSFLKICKDIFDTAPSSFDQIKIFQNEILGYFKNTNSHEFSAYINEAFDILEKNSVLESSLHVKLKEQFYTKEEEKTIIPDEVGFDANFDFNQKLDTLFNIINELKNIIDSSTLQSKILQAKEALKNRKFSIGVTGVMNAGKSTLLNALMKSNVLGTAVVPETANLSIIKYSKEKHAVVNYWSKQEWDDIVKSADSIASMKEFVYGTNEIFGEKLNDFIREIPLKEKIKIEELANYTSAIASNKKCNLVKSVELYMDLPFLEDGVMIVDTPGLDDPVIQREEITKKYLSQCDLMMHLMNVSQSATAKDVEFIIDTLTYQGISRLLIVLTRVDTISKEELEEVKNYTKRSIKAKLSEQNKGALFDSILKKLEFIEVSGKLALMHRLGGKEEALRLGFTEEQTGITKIEKYLNDVLFGAKSPKAALLLNSNAKILYACTNESIKIYSNEKDNLNKSSNELKSLLKEKECENKKQEDDINKILLHVKNTKNELETYAITLLLETEQRANSLKNKIYSRVFDDIKYDLSKNKKRPADERISYFIDTGIKDGLLDIIRDYRFNFSKKSDASYEKISFMLDENAVLQTKNIFDVKNFFSLNKNSINTNFQALINDVLSAVKKVSKSNIDEFGRTFEKFLTTSFKRVACELEDVLKSLNSSLIEEFTKSIEEPLKFKKTMLNEEIEALKNQINMIEENVENAKLKAELLNKKILTLENLKKSLEKFVF